MIEGRHEIEVPPPAIKTFATFDEMMNYMKEGR
jgi:hypothetical protein